MGLKDTTNSLRSVNEVAFKANYSQDFLSGKARIFREAREAGAPKYKIKAVTTSSKANKRDPGKLEGNITARRPVYVMVNSFVPERSRASKYGITDFSTKLLSTKKKLKENDVVELTISRRGTSQWLVFQVVKSESELPPSKYGLFADVEGSWLDGDTIHSREVEGPFYAVGAWGNPYRANDNEFFFSGPKETRKDAKSFIDFKMEHGQPTKFRDWAQGPSKVFNSKEKARAYLKKQGINANYEDDD